MKLTTKILAITVMAGAVWAKNAAAVPAQTAKPVAGSPAPAVKAATIPAATSASAANSSSPSGQNNKLQRVNVVQSADNIRIEISSSSAVTPRVSKLTSPARILVELPGTVMASSKNNIPVGSGGVKDLRIGTNGKTPPTTSVVVDLEKAVAYELTPGPADKLVLTLHTQAGAKTEPAPAKGTTAATQSKPATAGQAKAVAAGQAKTAAAAQPKSAAATAAAQPKSTAAPQPKVAAMPQPKVVAKSAGPTAKPQPVVAKANVAVKPAVAVKARAATEAPKAPIKVTAKAAAPKVSAKETNETTVDAAAKISDGEKKAAASEPAKPQEKKWAMSGKRDPFFSPVVQQTSGAGCSTGKKCLEIGQINLRGVVKSDNGFIAVVTNNMNKAYFLRENDPVFNGYVVKITGDSVVFQETVQDKLGKTFTREVVKRLFTPAV